MSNDVRAFIGKGQIYLRRRDQAAGLKPIGEASGFELQIETDEKTLPSNTQSGGGVAATAYSVSSMSLSITGHTFTDEMVAMALFGDVSKIEAAAVLDEPHKAYKGALIPFAKLPDFNVPVVVKPETGDAYVEGVDYTLSSAGIRIQAGGSIDDGADILVSYSGVAHSAIEMLTNSGFEYELFFEGFNDADNGLPFNVQLHRCKFSPSAGFGFIQDDFAENALSGSVLTDTSKTGAGLSKYAKITRV